jgi:hypothetical protein
MQKRALGEKVLLLGCGKKSLRRTEEKQTKVSTSETWDLSLTLLDRDREAKEVIRFQLVGGGCHSRDTTPHLHISNRKQAHVEVAVLSISKSQELEDGFLE